MKTSVLSNVLLAKFLAMSMFRRADIPRRLFPAAYIAGAGTFAMTAPFTPSTQNIIPTRYLGTHNGGRVNQRHDAVLRTGVDVLPERKEVMGQPFEIDHKGNQQAKRQRADDWQVCHIEDYNQGNHGNQRNNHIRKSCIFLRLLPWPLRLRAGAPMATPI